MITESEQIDPEEENEDDWKFEDGEETPTRCQMLTLEELVDELNADGIAHEDPEIADQLLEAGHRLQYMKAVLDELATFVDNELWEIRKLPEDEQEGMKALAERIKKCSRGTHEQPTE